MKDSVWVPDFSSHVDVRNFRPILLDANVLMGVAHVESLFHDVDQLMRFWRRLQTSSVAFVADFIRIEALNAERQSYRTSRVRYFLKEVERSSDGFYIDVRTPIRRVLATRRGRYLNLLPRRDRHVLLRDYPELSGTDIALLAVSVCIRDSAGKAVVASMDKELVAAAEALGVVPFKNLPI